MPSAMHSSAPDVANPLALVKLTTLMERTSGNPEVKIALIDGPVALEHPDLDAERVREIPGHHGASCSRTDSAACLHGTFVAGILSAKRGSSAPAICPGCTVLVRPIFAEGVPRQGQLPSATSAELATSILECIDAGARIINLSLAVAQPSAREEHALEEALGQALRRGVIVAAAAGNQGTISGSAITRHPWVIPVVGCDLRGRPLTQSNLSGSIGRRGLRAPGEGITSLGAAGQSLTLGGTSVAVPFVSGAVALLWSAVPSATAAQLKLAVAHASAARRTSVVPPLLDVAAAYEILSTMAARSRVA
jgi:subtilisin family serine protease